MSTSMRSSVSGVDAFPTIGRFETGADALKYLPPRVGGPASLRAVKVVSASEAPVSAVGGLDVGSVGGWINAGAAGLGLGSSVLAPGMAARMSARGPPPLSPPGAPQIGIVAAGAASALRLPGLRQTGGVNASPSAEPPVGNAVGGPPTLAANRSASRLASCELRSIR